MLRPERVVAQWWLPPEKSQAIKMSLWKVWALNDLKTL